MVSGTRRAATLAVLVAALGYFVDIYDLILFGMVRNASLRGLGVPEGELTSQGIYLFNMQMAGMLVGGILWGILGDKRGRLSVLFGSITLYSVANIVNGMVGDVDAMRSIDAYALCRLVAGIGLAGELGAGVTLVTELMGRENRGIGTTIVAGVGVSGGLVAGLLGGAFPGIGVHWTTAYYTGGAMGLLLLLLRIGVVESGMFAKVLADDGVVRGDLRQLFDRRRLKRYLAIICVGVPVWYVIGILFVLSPELGGALGLDPKPNAARALFFCYGGCALGGVASGMLSQYLKSRRRAIAAFLVACCLVTTAYFAVGGASQVGFYVLCGLGGFATGYWAVFVTTAAELFGTNLRATVTTTVPNFVRGSAVLLTLGFRELSPHLGLVGAAIAVGIFSMTIAFAGLFTLSETFGEDLDYHER